MNLIDDGLRILKQVDKGLNAPLYKELGEWIERVRELDKIAGDLRRDNANLNDQLRFKGMVSRIAGHTFAEGDDEEICSRCAEVDHRLVHCIDMNVVGDGRRSACPHCKTPGPTPGPPISRRRAEEIALRRAEHKDV